jgi:hypothetical protein
MARFDLMIGLNQRGKDIVHCLRRETVGHILGAYKPRVGALRRYTNPADGRVFYDYVRCDNWFCGPNYFMALKDEDGEIVPASLWREDELC